MNLHQLSAKLDDLINFSRVDQFVKSIRDPKIHPSLRNAMGWHLRENQLPGLSGMFSKPDLPKGSIDANEAARLLRYRRHPALTKKHVNSPWPKVPGFDNPYAPFPQLGR